jgi:tetratricopeptide (TPR) repeat protein
VYRFWQKQEYTLTAQLHQRGNRLYLHIVLYHYLDHQPKLIWHLEGDPSVSLPDQKEALLREWIYRLIANQASPSLGTNSWRALEAYFDGLVLWQRYQEDGRFLADFLQQAAQKFQNAQNADPTFLATQFALGTIYNTQGHYEKAEIAFRNLVANDKDNLPLHYNLGVSYYHQVEKGRWAREKAVEQFLRIQNELEKQDTKNEYTDTLLALTYSSLAMICGLEMYDKNNPSEWVFDKTVERLEAVRIYTSKSQIAAQKIGDEKIKKIVLASSNHAMGFAYLQDKQFESARDFLERAIKEYPEYPVPYANLARACKNPDQAIVWLNRAVSIQPGFAYGWYQLGEIYYKTRATPDLRKKAWDAFIKAEGFADAQEKLGTMAFKDGNYESAMQYYYTAVRLNKHKEHIWRNMAWRTLQAIELDWISASQDVLQNALEWADQALHIARGTENEWRAHDVRGWALSLLALPDDALEAYDKSLKLNKNAQNLYHRAQVYVQTKNHIAAMVDLDEAKACANYKKWAMVIYTLQQEIGQLS